MRVEIELAKSRAGFALEAAFAADEGVTVLFGRSGAGKSTLLSLVAGLERPDRGRIALDGRLLFESRTAIDLKPERRQIGMVFQDGRLFPHLSVRGNLRYGMKGQSRAPLASFDEIVSLLGIAPLLSRMPARLSGGEKQRVALGRALLAAPRLLLLDEPLAALDGARKAELLPYIAGLARRFTIPILYVTHSLDEVVALADRLIILEDGRIQAAGSALDVLAATDLSAITGRQDAGALFEARIEAHHPEGGMTALDLAGIRLMVPLLDRAPGEEVRLRIGAAEVALSLDPPGRTSVQNILPGVVRSVEEGPAGQVDVRIDIHQPCSGRDHPGPLLWSRISRAAALSLALEPGMRVHALIKSLAIARQDIRPRPVPPGSRPREAGPCPSAGPRDGTPPPP